jgi:glutamate-5-semialdehyde dehydrogenase
MARPPMDCDRLERLTEGMPIPYGGDKLAHVPAALAAAFRPGDRLIVVQDTGDLLRAPAAVHRLAAEAVGRAATAFADLARVSDEAIAAFFDAFAQRLEADAVWADVAEANVADLAAARARGRPTGRLEATPRMRADMIAGLRLWRDAGPMRERLIERVDHPGFVVEQVSAPLGVIGFVFEGRPNVFADAAGVVRSGNTAVFRIGSDALGTARAIMARALAPALAQSGLPHGACVLLDSPEHAAGWALFSDPRLALAVARGSGAAVAQLGAVARQTGLPVSLHGTGGAWLIADESADTARFAAAVAGSLDRKVCNTLNVCCVVRSRAAELVPLFLEALERAGETRGRGSRLHVAEGDEAWLTEAWRRRAEPLASFELGKEWEWDETPEAALKVVGSLGEAIDLFNVLSPRFSASLIADDRQAQERFWREIEAGFVGDGMTRWVDGQYALARPELGLSNWEHGRLFARGGMLCGDGVFTIRTRMRQQDPNLKR